MIDSVKGQVRFKRSDMQLFDVSKNTKTEIRIQFKVWLPLFTSVIQFKVWPPVVTDVCVINSSYNDLYLMH